MTETARFLSGFDPVPEDVALPARVLRDYAPDSCLSRREDRLVLRLRRRADGALFVLKACPAGLEDLEAEYRILTRLAPLLPGAVPASEALFSENDTVWLLRTYLPGRTLSQDREGAGGCDPETCRRLGRQLCALLAILHNQDPPVIHRDIKPENILLLPDGGVGLIDFGIARQFKADRNTDTRQMGTRSTAAPEQYGFAQTDGRTDLYALGMTLIWLLTGSYSRESLAARQDLPPALRRALEKATAFSPDDRFPDVVAFSAALEDRPRRRTLPLLAAVLVCAVAVGAALLWPVRTGAEPAALQAEEADRPAGDPADAPDAAAETLTPEISAQEEAPPEAVEFTSQTMEAAVRLALNAPSGDITADRLSAIERLAVVGRNAFGPEQTFDYRIGCYIDNAYQFEEPWGDMTDEDLSLLAQMPNLRELYLCRQDISDLSVLSGLPLRTLAICETRVTDLSPLASLTELETLYLSGNPAVDYSVLGKLTGLRTLNLEGSGELGMTTADNLRFLDNLDLRRLCLGMTMPADGDWTPLARQTGLQELQLWNPQTGAVAAMGGMTDLRYLFLADYAAQDLRALSGLTGLETLNLHNGSMTSLRGMESMGALTTLSIGYSAVTDLAPLSGLTRLNYVQLIGMDIGDYGPLNTLPVLADVRVDADRLAAVEADCPDHVFRLESN